MAHLLNRSKNQIICSEVIVATSFWQRSRGLIGKKELSADAAMWICECNWIHTFFMSFPIDAVFINKKMIVQQIKYNIHPGRLTLPVWKAHSVIEMASGTAQQNRIAIGDQLDVGS